MTGQEGGRKNPVQWYNFIPATSWNAEHFHLRGKITIFVV